MTTAVTWTVEAAFGDAPLDTTPTYTDVSAYVLGVDIRRGRSSFLDAFSAGTATIKLDNTDRRFDPTNAAGPYAGDLLPLVRFRIRATTATPTVHDVFTGWVQPLEGWAGEYDMPADAVMEVRLIDSLGVLALDRVGAATAAGANEKSGARVGRILDDSGWPSGAAWRSIDTGISRIVSDYEGRGNVLSLLQDVAASESGALLATKAGVVRFDDRHHPIRVAAMTTARYVLDDAPSGAHLDYAAPPTIEYASEMFNVVRVTPASGNVQTESDLAAVAAYTRQPLELDMDVSDNDARAAAEWYLAAFHEPYAGPAALAVEGHLAADATADDLLLATELRDRISVYFWPPGGGDAIDKHVFAESLAWTIDAKEWHLAIGCSAADRFDNIATYSEWLELNHASRGLLNTAKLAY